MAKGNGQVEEGLEERVKWCPMIKEWCTGEVKGRCAFTKELHQRVGGMERKIVMCFTDAVVLMLGEINAKAGRGEQEKVKLYIPGQIKG